MLPNPVYKDHITLIQEPEEDIAMKENFRSVSLISIIAKILNVILEIESNNMFKGRNTK